MKGKGRFVLVALLMFVSRGAQAGSGTQYSGVTSMTFQDGVSPTADYAGFLDTFINSSAADSGKNFGSSDTLYCSSVGYQGPFRAYENSMLLSVDITALPDSAVVTKAVLYIRQLAGASGLYGEDTLQLARIYPPWTPGTGTGTASVSSATWTTRHADDSPADVYTGGNWTTPGCKATTALTGIPVGPTATTDTTFSFSGSDTLDVKSAAVASIDCTHTLASALARSGPPAVAKLGWVAFDVTRQVNAWHTRRNTNNGVKISVTPASNDKAFKFASSEYAASKDYRPKLTIWYFDPTTLARSHRRIGAQMRAGAGVY